MAALLATLIFAAAEFDNSAAYVLACHNPAEWRESDSSSWQELEPGLWLPASASLRTGHEGQIDLLFPDNAVAAITQDQTYSIRARKAVDRPGRTGFWKALTGLLSSFIPGGDPGKAAGVRSLTPGQAEKIQLTLPVNASLVGPSIVLRWSGGLPDKPFRLSLQSKDKTPKAGWESAGYETTFDRARYNLQDGTTYYWTVAQEGQTAPMRETFHIVSKSEAKKLGAELDVWMKDCGSLSPAGQHVMRGLFYAQRHYAVDALVAFQTAANAAGNPEAYAQLVKALELQH